MALASHRPAASPSSDLAPTLPPGIIFGGPAVWWKNAESYVLLALFLGGSLAAILWTAVHGIGAIELWCFTIGFCVTTFGIGVGVHRYLVHRAFQCGQVMKATLCIVGQLACQGSLLKWVGNHRRHHLHADEAGDPHSPHVDDRGNAIGGLRGLLHAHNGWLFDDTMTDNSHYAKDMLADPLVMAITRSRWLWYALSMVVLPGLFGYALGGTEPMIGCILVAGFFRAYFVIMCSVSVGSIGHRFGSQRFADIGDHSRNNWMLAAITFGEGWHNNHHRFPRNASAGLAWYEIDLNGMLILLLEKLGLVWMVVRTPGSEHYGGLPFDRFRKPRQDSLDEAGPISNPTV